MPIAIMVLRGLEILLDIFQWLVFVWVVLSWIVFFLQNSQFRWRYRGLYGALVNLNDLFGRIMHPLLRPIRRWLRRVNAGGRIDWSPMVLVFILWVLRMVIRAVIRRLILT